MFLESDYKCKRNCKSVNVSPSTRCSDLTDEEITRIRAIIDENYQTEGDLRRFILKIKNV